MRSVAAGTVRHFVLFAAGVDALGGAGGLSMPEVRYSRGGSLH